MAVLFTVVSVALALWRRRKGDLRAVVVFFDRGPRAWWWLWTALWVACLSLAYLAGGPQFMAWLAGASPGTVLAMLVTFLVVRRLQAG